MKKVARATLNHPNKVQANKKRRIPSFLSLLMLLPILTLWSCTGGGEKQGSSSPTPQPTVETSLKLWDTVTPGEGVKASGQDIELKVKPGSEAEAKAYYLQLQQKLVNFPKSPLIESSIGDMLVYYGFPALLAKDLEALDPEDLMDFKKLREAVSNKPDFESAYATKPLQPDEILVSRFFAPKIIAVSDPQPDVPISGFGWRKVLRFRARIGSPARSDGLDAFYLLFNFADNATKFPKGKPAGQIQALLVPTYPTAGKHNDIYFLVYDNLTKPNPGKVGLFLEATFDLASGVPADGKYYVPIACGQCHGTEKVNQPGGKVNYLDTDHWFDRTGDDFKLVKPADVLVDGEAQAYDTIRKLNAEIEKQNSAVLGASDPKFALLAVKKWLELHKVGGPNANRHVPAIDRGLAEAAGDPIWTAGTDPDDKLLPLMNQYCFRCHSSVRFHAFQKGEVIKRKSGILARIRSGNMPQDRKLTDETKNKLLPLIEKLPNP